MVGKHDPLIALVGPGMLYRDTKEIFYGRILPRVPTVVTVIAGFSRGAIAEGKDGYILKAEAREPTTSKFDLFAMATDVRIRRLEISWIACA